MKIKLFCTTIALVAMFVFAPQAKALPTTATTPTTELHEKTFSEKFSTYVTKQKKKRGERIMKALVKAEKFTSKLAQKIDLEDDTTKWLWYAVFAYAASIILWILAVAGIPIVGILSGVAGLLASVCLIIWLIKYLDLA